MQLPSSPLVIHQRVGFSQTDAAGLIHFTTYFTFMEAAEAELFRSLGLELLQTDKGRTCGYPRVDCQCRFRRPVGFDDLIQIELRIGSIQDNRIHYDFLFLGPDGSRCATGSMVTAHACREEEGSLSSVPLPAAVREKLEAWKNQAL
ncbi:MAG TPA: thioesterase family protein [Oceanipulchritudo sp.]|nr:thioesterase family protein [Oceanipulchritudo sp.]